MRVHPVVLLNIALLTGCSSEPYKIAPVSGQVTLNGRPLANASVTFAPLATKGNDEPGPSSSAPTDANGRYTLQVIGQERKGAVVGKHKVRIAVIEESNASDDRPARVNQLPLKYNGQTTLEFQVPAEGTTSADFKLTVP